MCVMVWPVRYCIVGGREGRMTVVQDSLCERRGSCLSCYALVGFCVGSPRKERMLPLWVFACEEPQVCFYGFY